MVNKKNKITIGKVIIVLILILTTFVTLYPIIYILSMSLSGAKHIILQDIYFFPKDLSIESYRILFSNNDIWVAYWNTIKYTIVGTVLSLCLTVMLAYSVSQKNFSARRIVIWFVMITMFFSGGIIPIYILINELKMMNSMWAIVLPGAVSAWYMIITRAYFATIPQSVFESASLDGAGEFRKLFFIGVPLAKPIIAVLALYMIVGYWNTYFSAVLYLDKVQLHPIQNYLEKILYNNEFGNTNDSSVNASLQVEQLKYSSIVVTMFPIMMIYPFLQKYFVHGIMVGSIKE